MIKIEGADSDPTLPDDANSDNQKNSDGIQILGADPDPTCNTMGIRRIRKTVMGFRFKERIPIALLQDDASRCIFPVRIF